MKITYDPQIDTLRILLKETPVQESDEDKPGVIFDYDKDGNVVGMRILNASQRVTNPHTIEYSITLKKAESELDKVVESQQSLTLAQRRAFMQLPLQERRRILAEQAEAMMEHYQQDTEWQELLAGDILDY